MNRFGKIVVSYVVLNFQVQEPRLEGFKTRPRLCVPRPRTRH